MQKIASTRPGESAPKAATPARAGAGHLLWQVLRGIAISLAFTPAVLAVNAAVHLQDVHIVFMIPVVVAATQFGLVSALASAVAATAASAFLFYEPIYSLAVFSPNRVVSLTIFVAVAAITSHLSAIARENASAAARNLRRLELLYAFSRKLAAATSPEEIYSAIQEHASALVEGRVRVLLAEEGGGQAGGGIDLVAPPVRSAMARRTPEDGNWNSELVVDEAGTPRWLLRPFPRNRETPGYLLVDLGLVGKEEAGAVRARIDRLLDDAVATLERLDLATTVGDAELRRQSASLREAVIGSASHGLRTPLASIMGSASILAAATPVAKDERLAGLAGIIVKEAERLNGDIQKMLDAATLSAAGVKPVLEWIEPSDIINAAVQAKERELEGHEVRIVHAEEVPMVLADPALVREALGLVLDNAARYSEPRSGIVITVRPPVDGMVAVTIEDEGIGIGPDDQKRVLEKFYRGTEVRDTTRGSGLGLWIASSFLQVSKGRLAIAAREDRKGTIVTLQLKAATEDQMQMLDGQDD